jgi:hypothetical protein
MGSKRITNLATPVSGSDAVTYELFLSGSGLQNVLLAGNTSNVGMYLSNNLFVGSNLDTSSIYFVPSQTTIGQNNISVPEAIFIVGSGYDSSSTENLLVAYPQTSGSAGFTSSYININSVLNAPNITGSIFGSASYALTSSYDSNAVYQVNGIVPINGAVTVPIGITITGTSASLELSSSGAVTSSIADATVWIISGETGSLSGSNGNSYIWASGSQQWNAITQNLASTDARYVLKTGDTITGNLTLSESIYLLGTSSWALEAVTSSYALTASYIVGNSQGTSSWAINALTASYLSGSVESASYAATASYINVLAGPNIVINTLPGVIEISSSAGIATALVSETAPAPGLLNTGSLWYDSVSGSLNIWYIDASGSQWVETNGNTSVTTGNGSMTDFGFVLTSSLGNQSITGGLDITGNTSVTGSLSTSGSTFLFGSSLTSGSSVITGSLSTLGNVNINGNITQTVGTGSFNRVETSTYIMPNYLTNNFPDDATAAAGGIPLGGIYRTGNFVVVRLT